MSENKKSAKPTKPTNATSDSNGEVGKRPKLSGKDLVFTFIVFFVVFGFVGYFRGRSVRNKPARLRWDIISKLSLGESGSRKVLAYRCNNKNEVIWDVDKDTYINQRTLDRQPEEFSYSPAIFNDENLIPVFLTGGGVISIFTAREILGFAASPGAASKIERESHIRLIITAALAIVSGYEIGYRVALHANYDCSDSRFTQILNDETNWKGDDQGWSGFEKICWNYLLNDLERREPRGFCQSDDVKEKNFEDNRFNLAKAQFIAFRDGGVMSFEHDITAADFDALRAYGQAVDEFNQNCRNAQRN